MDGYRETNLPLFARGQLHLVECLELSDGGHNGTYRIPDIQLHDFAARPAARVFHADVHPQGVGRGELPGNSLHSGIFEPRVARSVSERIERFGVREDVIAPRTVGGAFLVVVAFVRGQVIVVARQVSGALRKRDGEPARRVRLPEKYSCDGGSGLLAGIPLHEHGIRQFPDAGQFERFARHEHDYHRFARPGEFFDEFLLHARQTQTGKVVALPAGRRFGCPGEYGALRPDECHDDVAPAGGFQGFAEPAFVLRIGIASLRIVHPHAGAGQVFPDSAQRGDALVLLRAPTVIAELYAVGVRADDGHRPQFAGRQRQHAVAVFEQYGAFVGDLPGEAHGFWSVYLPPPAERVRRFPVEEAGSEFGE